MFFWICNISLFSTDLPFTPKSYPWLAKCWEVILQGKCLFYISIMCLRNFLHKLSIGASIELVVLNMEITFLTSDLRRSKSPSFYMKNFWRGSLEYFGWQAAPANMSLTWSLKLGICKHFPTKLGLFVIKRSCMWFFLVWKLNDGSELHRPSVSRNNSLRTFGYWLPITDLVS